MSPFLILRNKKTFLDWIVMCDKKWVLYDNQWWPVQWLDQEAAPKHFPKPNLHQKKVMVTVWWSAAQMIHYAFWIPVKPLHLRSMLGKLKRCMKTAMPEASTGQQTGPNCTLHNQRFRSWMKRATKFCLICHIYLTSCQLTTTSSIISPTFCAENPSTTGRIQKMLSKSSLNPEAQIFTLQE